MKFFSGFSLANEEYLFADYIQESVYTVSGFSYGAIAALKYAREAVENSKRIDTLQLFSPAFFQNRDEKFKRLQLMSYKKNNHQYMKQFLEGCFFPYEKKIVGNRTTNVAELQQLLEYQWSIDEFMILKECGVVIEVYLGGCDKIIDANEAKEFFLNVATVTYIKNANHFLQLN